MSDLFNSPALVPAGILIASLVGSAHCVGMCGGLVAGFARDARGLALYHLGRLASYATLGAFAGWLGGAALGLPAFLGQGVTVFFAILLVAAGAARVRGRPLHGALPRRLAALSARAFGTLGTRAGSRPATFALGALSALLPCGWLYTFVLAAAATRSPALGAAALALFWLGTVPALTAAPALFNLLTTRLRAMTPKLSGALLIAAGLFSLGLHASVGSVKANVTDTKPTCPMHSHQ